MIFREERPQNDQRPQQQDAGKKAAINTGICVLAGIGLIMSMQSTSLMNGTSNIWMGVVLAAAGLAVSLFLGAHVGVRVACAIAVAIALVSALGMEHQMSERREQISRTLHSSGPVCYDTGPGYEKCIDSWHGDYQHPLYQGPKVDRGGGYTPSAPVPPWGY